MFLNFTANTQLDPPRPTPKDPLASPGTLHTKQTCNGPQWLQTHKSTALHTIQGVIRAVPEIIWVWATFFFRPHHSQDKHGVGAPQPPGHASALINLSHYRSNMPWHPGHVTPHPWDMSTKHPPPPTGQKSAWPPPRIISGTALSGDQFTASTLLLALLSVFCTQLSVHECLWLQYIQYW